MAARNNAQCIVYSFCVERKILYGRTLFHYCLWQGKQQYGAREHMYEAVPYTRDLQSLTLNKYILSDIPR